MLPNALPVRASWPSDWLGSAGIWLYWDPAAGSLDVWLGCNWMYSLLFALIPRRLSSS
jgi:hypothetical protein